MKRYERYKASGSTDPYSVWMREKVAAWMGADPRARRFMRADLSHGVERRTEAEARCWALAVHGDRFDAFLATGHLPDCSGT